MPLYEYRCSSCRGTFELLRPMAKSSEPAVCPEGHTGAGRIVSLVAAPARDGSRLPEARGGCGGCAGGACACGG